MDICAAAMGGGMEIFMGLFKDLRKSFCGKTLYVVGHAPADFDTLASAYLVSGWLENVGILSEPLFPDVAMMPDRHPIDAMALHGIDVNEWRRASDAALLPSPWVLTDTHTPCIEHPVAAVIDHHPTGEAMPAPAELCFNAAASSCALAAYRLALADGVDISDDDEKLVVRSVYMDTQALLSPKFDTNDRAWLDVMIKKHSLDEGELKRRGLCLADLSLPTEVLAEGWTKHYLLAGKKCASSHLQSENIPEDLIFDAVRHLEGRRVDEGIDIWVFSVAEPLEGRSIVIEISDNGVHRREFNRFLSRSKDIIPDLERRLRSGLDF